MTFKDNPKFENGHFNSRRPELTNIFERVLVFKYHIRLHARVAFSPHRAAPFQVLVSAQSFMEGNKQAPVELNSTAPFEMV